LPAPLCSASRTRLSRPPRAILKAFGAGALLAMAAETMIPEAFHNGPRYSGVLAASGFATLILLSEVAK
jgi:zinc transporter, ZIP family